MKLSGSLPKPDDDHERNGLAAHASDVVRHPDERRIAIVVLSTKQLVDNRDKHTIEPVMAVDRIELVRPVDASAAERLLVSALQHRTHRDTLPVFIANDIEKAFADGAIDHNTGQSYVAGDLFPSVEVTETEKGGFHLHIAGDEPVDEDQEADDDA